MYARPSPGRSAALLAAALGLASTPAAAAPSPEAYVPLVHFESKGGMIFEAPLALAARFEDVSRYRLDAQGATLGASGLNNQLRLGARFDSKLALLPFLFLAEYEHDLLTGPATGQPDLQGVGLWGQGSTETQLRKLWGRASLGPYLHLGGGVMTSHFGLGLLANDGAHGWTPGSARFTDPRGGDRVLRGFLASGPLASEKLFFSLAYDRVLGDDVLFDGDEARQVVGAAIFGRGEPTWFGVYGAHRVQDAASGRQTRVNVIDFSGSAQLALDALGTLTLEGELAIVTGETELAGSPEFPVHGVDQAALALRAAWDAGAAGGVLDFLYASGDADLDDGAQGAFKVDPSYSLGLLLFPHLVAAQTGRAAVRAADPQVVGHPAADVERYATRGSASNTVALAPRAFWRPASGLELYGGPLFAWTAVPYIDPYATRIAGGVARNAYDGSPGYYLGTELDLGARYRVLLAGTELTVGVESGVLIPGDAFADRTGARPDAIAGGRVLASWRL